MTFSWNQLFRDNRYSGADRQADANQLTLAISTRMIRQSDGHERLSLGGQIRYFADSRVRLPNEPITEQGRSAWVVDANYAPTDRWTIGASYQRDPKFNRTDLASVRARYLLPNQGVFNLSYRYRRALLEQVDASFLLPDQRALEQAWSQPLFTARQQNAGKPGWRAMGQLLCCRSGCGPPLRAKSRWRSRQYPDVRNRAEGPGLSRPRYPSAPCAPGHPRLQSR